MILRYSSRWRAIGKKTGFQISKEIDRNSDNEYLTLDLTAVKNMNTEDFNIFKSIIEDAFKEFGKPQLWIVVASDDLS